MLAQQPWYNNVSQNTLTNNPSTDGIRSCSVRIDGIVQSSQGKIIKILAPDTGMVVAVDCSAIYPNYVPIMKYDIISVDAHCFMIMGQQQRTYKMCREPKVTLTIDPQLLPMFFHMAIPDITGHKVNVLIESLQDVVNYDVLGYTDVYDLMSKICDAWWNDPETQLVRLLRDITYIEKDRSVVLLSVQQIEDLLEWWEAKRLSRQLKLLGITNDETKEIDIAPYALYLRLKSNPFTIAQLSHDKCVHVSQIIGRDVKPIDVRCHDIVHYIYNKVKNGDMCVRHATLVKVHPYVYDYEVVLKQQYEYVDCQLPSYLNDDWDGYNRTCKPIDQSYYCYLQPQYDIEVFNYEYMVKSINDEFYLGDIQITYDTDEGFDLDDSQRAAVDMALSNNVSLLTGSAGCGKTTIVNVLKKNLENNNIDYFVTSLTGKAVCRAMELGKIGSNASTMHKMLFGNDPITFKYCIFDESTMIPAKILYLFLKQFCLNRGVVCIFIGDWQQLQPIDYGSPFMELFNSRCVQCITLSTNHRVKTKSGVTDGIIYNSSCIADSEPGKTYIFTPTDNFIIKPCDAQGLLNTISQMQIEGIGPEDIKIIAPYTSDYGIAELKEFCQYIWARKLVPLTDDTNIQSDTHIDEKGNKWTWQFNQHITEPYIMKNRTERRKWFIDDTVIVLNNDNKVGIFNGQEGKVTGFTANGILVTFETIDAIKPDEQQREGITVKSIIKTDKNGSVRLIDRVIEFPFWQPDKPYKKSRHNRDNEVGQGIDTSYLDLSHILTAHKAQGSQWKRVIVYMPKGTKSNPRFLTRDLFYVAITRASEMVLLMGEVMDICISIGNSRPKRCEMLCERLKSLPRLRPPVTYTPDGYDFDYVPDYDDCDGAYEPF